MIAQKNNLSTRPKKKTYIGEAELRVLVNTAYKQNKDWDQTLKHITLWFIMKYSASRPGSLVRSTTHHDENHCLKWEVR
jgi:hypothetical protein